MGDPSENARPANAEDGKTTPLSPGHRTIPIIIVPGIMGSRLSDMRGNLVWNPTGSPSGNDAGVFTAVVDQLADVKAKLLPDTRHPFNATTEIKSFIRAEKITNFYHLVSDFYGDLCFAMQEDLAVKLKSLNKPISPRVYCSGYDWRQDNSESALLLGKVVAQAQRDCDGEKVILIAHSMGGLVSRYYCKTGGEKNVLALFLLGSPSLGAPKSYWMLKAGMPMVNATASDRLLRLLVLGKFLRSSSRDLLRRLPSAYQLVPTPLYGNLKPRWLTFDATRTGYPRSWNAPLPIVPDPRKQFSGCNVPEEVIYKDIYTGFMDEPFQRLANQQNITQAAAFHAMLTGPGDTVYMPPHTFTIFTSMLMTASGAGLDFGGVSVPVLQQGGENGFNNDRNDVVVETDMTESMTAFGDGTVPEISANPPATPPFDDFLRRRDVEHGALPKDPNTIRFIIETIASHL
ncbi:MAG: lipase family alpha/beta hydrolase [Byssovorax sp.]